MVIGLGAAVLVIVAVIAIFGYYQTKVRPMGETVIQVGDRSFNLRYLERRLRYDVRELPTQSAEILITVLNELPSRIAREELMRQGAPEKGVDLSEEAIDAEIGRRVGAAASADRSAFAAGYRDVVRESGLSTESYRDVIAVDLAEGALRTMFDEEVPETAEQVRYRVIVLITEDDAQEALERLQNGEDFAVVAQELSEDAASGEQGGEQDWTLQDLLQPALGDVLFSLEVGQLSDVITGENAVFIAEVLERETERETTPIQRSSLATRAMAEWLAELGERLVVTITLDGDQRTSIEEVLQSEASRGQ